MPVRIGFRTSPQNVDWATLDAAWAEAGQRDVFDSGWMNDHLTDPGRETGGPSYESMTAMAALAHRVPGKVVGHTVLSITFRHPGVLAKQALTLDHVTGGRFVLGLGAGWHEGEHRAFGVPLPPIGERFDLLEATLRALRAWFSDEATRDPGVDLDAGPLRIRGGRMEPQPIRHGGPPIWLGGQKRRGMALAARYADGWNYSANLAGSVDGFRERLDALRRACDAEGRDMAELVISVQLPAGEDARSRREARDGAIAYARAGAEPLRDAVG